MIFSYKFRLYPTAEQDHKFLWMLGCCRWVWNNLLALNIRYHDATGKFLSYIDMNALLPPAKEKYPWLAGCHARALQNQAKRLDLALKACFKSGKGFPKFKSRRDAQSLTFPQMTEREGRILSPKTGKVYLPSFLEGIKFRGHPDIAEGAVAKTATITRDKTGCWYCSISCEVPDVEPVAKIKSSIGLDMGIGKYLFVTSNGTKAKNPNRKRRVKKLLKKVKRQQRALSHKKKDKKRKLKDGTIRYSVAKNRSKARLRYAKTWKRITNIKNDYQWKVTAAITKSYDLVAVEDLDVKDMMKKSGHHGKSFREASIGNFISKLEWQCKKRGKVFRKVDPAYTSQTCSSCGHVQEMPLYKRTYHCPECGLVLDRDYNAACNILARALA